MHDHYEYTFTFVTAILSHKHTLVCSWAFHLFFGSKIDDECSTGYYTHLSTPHHWNPFRCFPLPTLILHLVGIPDELTVRTAPESPPKGGVTSQYGPQPEQVATAFEKCMQLCCSRFIIQSRLFFNNLINFCCHFGWSSAPWFALDGSFALISLQNLSNTLPACTQTFFSQQLGYGWSFVLPLEVVE